MPASQATELFSPTARCAAPAIYVVAVDDASQQSLIAVICGLGWEARIFDKAADCLDASTANSPDCFICNLDQEEGASLAKLLITQHCDIPCVAITADADAALSKRVIFIGAFTGRWEMVLQSDRIQLRKAIIESLLSWLRHPTRRLLAPVATPPPLLDPDFRAALKGQASSDLVLTPDFDVAAMSDRYAASTMINPEGHYGRFLFDLFPNNPNDPDATGVANLNASLQRVRLLNRPDRMPLQRYDIRVENGSGLFEERWWYPVNFPVFHDNKLHHIVHRVQDVTRFVHLHKMCGHQLL